MSLRNQLVAKKFAENTEDPNLTEMSKFGYFPKEESYVVRQQYYEKDEEDSDDSDSDK